MFKMIKKGQDGFRGQFGEVELVDGSMEAAGKKGKKEAEGIAISGDGLGAEVALGT